MKNSTQRSVISTLALYAAEMRSALTQNEIYLYLHKSKSDTLKPAEKAVSDCLLELVGKGTIFKKNDYYSLENRAELAKENIKKAAQSAEKIKKNKWPLIFLRAVPFVCAIAITGSVAMKNANKKSDIDLLIITEKGKIWTARILALLIIELFGRRRYNARKTEKVCLNFFIASDNEAPIQNIAMANMIRSAMPIYGIKKYNEFIAQNKWIENFLYPQTPAAANAERVPPIAKILEYFLSGKTGDRLERFFKDWQYRRLAAKITTPQNLEHFILTDEILMLHYPDPKNKKVMEKYIQIMGNF